MCTSPRQASFNQDGSICFSQKHANKELVPFRLPCGKCTECLLERARDWSVRCIHESRLHQNNSFITLTYSDENLPIDGQLNYFDFQLFMRRVRNKYGQNIGFFMCGEYGEQTLRPHYHACLFGLDFNDKKQVRESAHGFPVYNSQELTDLWSLGHTELGSVTQQSAGYVARYVLKKQDPSSPQGFQKMSRKYAIGKRFLEKYWRDIFIHAHGSVILDDGSKTKVPRYYEKWLQKHQPEEWLCYITNIKPENTKRLQAKAEEQQQIYENELEQRLLKHKPGKYDSPQKRKDNILKHKQKQLKRSYL